MQNINNNQLQGAETYSIINQGFDFQSIPYEDFALVSDAAVNSQTTVSQSQEHFVCWNSSVINPHTDVTVHHVNPQNQGSFMSWNSSTLNSQTDVAVNHDNPQSQKHFILWNSSTQDEIVNGLPNIDQPQSIFASQPLFSDEKVFPSDSNKERSRISKYASELGSRDDDAVVISEEEFTRKKNKRLKKSELKKSELHNQSERNRRNAIKDKIHILGGLVPNCTKRIYHFQTDQASILSDVVDHMKALLVQRQMLSMTGHPMWLAGVPNSITQQIPQYMPYMGMGMGSNMYGYSVRGTSHPFLSIPSAPTPSLPILSESCIVSCPQFQVPPPPLSPTTFIAAQVKPTATTTFNTIDTVVQPQPIPYTINLANQGECSTSQYNAIGTRDHNQKVPTLSEIYKVMASGRIPPHSGP
ncbi:PREDICTED: uncharacterized protein LOC101314095 [Fragaria vesca subsp. vesca]|uniref:uncharacterized protein LOC101314095 n=1 Tax=Fragaria vesca subsp. vesca TaxID=101020 RepID=UPI0002C2F24F|nr:PREDICTED: uncharacterized protein LOC101314095 [Fragaria vesca subsp. vesca]